MRSPALLLRAREKTSSAAAAHGNGNGTSTLPPRHRGRLADSPEARSRQVL